jgi:hypothetical protein
MMNEERIRQADQQMADSSVSTSLFQQADVELAKELCTHFKLEFGTLVRRASAIALLADTDSVADRLREAAQHLIYTSESPEAIRAAVNNVLLLSAAASMCEFCAAISALSKHLECAIEQSDQEIVSVKFDGQEYKSTGYRSLYGFKAIVLIFLASFIRRRRPAWALRCPTTWFRRPIDSTGYVPDRFVDASWQYQTRVCPRCDLGFTSGFDSGQCPTCGTYFRASDIYGLHPEFDLEEMMRHEAADYPNFFELEAKRLDELPPVSPDLTDEHLWYQQFFRRRITKALDEGAELYYWCEWCEFSEVHLHWLFAVKYGRIVERISF